jgi:hypothetical protein
MTTATRQPLPDVSLSWGAPSKPQAHPNVGRTVVYRSGGNHEANKPAIILAQSEQVVDLAVMTYNHGMVTELGATMIPAPSTPPDPDWPGMNRENVCWLVRGDS